MIVYFSGTGNSRFVAEKIAEQVAAEVSAALKARIGVKPARVVVHPDGGLDTRSEHKSKRVIDERNLEYVI